MSSTHNQTLPLFRLPLELREQIYADILGPQSIKLMQIRDFICKDTRWSSRPRRKLDALKVCKAMHQEIMNLLYRTIPLYITLDIFSGHIPWQHCGGTGYEAFEPAWGPMDFRPVLERIQHAELSIPLADSVAHQMEIIKFLRWMKCVFDGREKAVRLTVGITSDRRNLRLDRNHSMVQVLGQFRTIEPFAIFHWHGPVNWSSLDPYHYPVGDASLDRSHTDKTIFEFGENVDDRGATRSKERCSPDFLEQQALVAFLKAAIELKEIDDLFRSKSRSEWYVEKFKRWWQGPPVRDGRLRPDKSSSRYERFLARGW